MALFDGLFGRPKKKVAPTETVGRTGTAVIGGYPETREKRSELQGQEKYTTFSDILVNTSIAAAGVRYFLNLVAKAEWQFEPADEDADHRFAELAEQAIIDDPEKSWHRIVRRAAMYRFYGFSVQEWTARRHRDGHLTFADIAPRAQSTIERWDVTKEGRVQGLTQRSPQTGEEIYLPREKLVYIVDDSLSDSPEGLGIFRHLVEPAKRLDRYLYLEGRGFETDLRGVPIGRAPFTALAKMVKEGKISQEQREKLEAPLREFVTNHITDKDEPSLGLYLDSVPYKTTDERQTPSQARQWDLELLKGDSKSFSENAAAIERLNQEIARILGVEALLLGDGKGSFALSKDKTNQFMLIVDSALKELSEAVYDDLLKPLWRLNGWPEDMMPRPRTEGAQFKDVEQVAAALKDMAVAGAVLAPDDPAIGEIRDLLGLSRPPETAPGMDAGDSALTGEAPEGEPENEDDLPEDPGQQGDE